MARIRSIHPGIFTDEAFMALSGSARTLLFGVLCEADDGGVVPWSPMKLKARYLPADAVDGLALLGELVQAGWLRCYEVAGATYAAIRNFRRWQRPKEPRLVHPMPDDMIPFVCGVTGRPAVGRPPSVSRDPAPAPDAGLVQTDLPLPDMRATADVMPMKAASGTIPEFPEIRTQREEGGGKREEGESQFVPPTPETHAREGRREAPGGVVVKTPIVDAFEAYNTMARALGLPQARVLSEGRRRQLRLRLRDCDGLAGWRDALAAVERSAGLCGKNDTGWRANLDWMLQETSFARLLEGQYDAWGRREAKLSYYDNIIATCARAEQAA